ncbi:ABC transporter ATP-binding protein [Oceanirhabdus sp. W0125-5]|nr:ABC transporter ATP-binding protein [Oceanirhabdus sp. W0125-5]WBW99724.1 ABC transporter ATP-binding protein [Oceanirhabdus sp. W0125-5]
MAMEIKISNLCKNYGAKNALKDINLKFEKGMYGLLGPNGAGKTTLMRILTTLIPKTSGEVTIGELNIKNKKRIREIIGYLPQDFSMYGNMSIYEAMDYLAILSGIKNKKQRRLKIDELLEKVNLTPHKKVKVRALSGGMKRRLGIAQALINNPKVLIVDEPTAGLDPEERIRFRNLLRDFSEDRVVILSTHIVEDVEFTCENLAILKEGKVRFNGKVSELLKKAEDKVWSFNINREKLDDIRKEYEILSTVSEGDTVRVRVLSESKPYETAEKMVPNIEDAYMRVMKEGM